MLSSQFAIGVDFLSGPRVIKLIKILSFMRSFFNKNISGNSLTESYIAGSTVLNSGYVLRLIMIKLGI